MLDTRGTTTAHHFTVWPRSCKLDYFFLATTSSKMTTAVGGRYPTRRMARARVCTSTTVTLP
eukprot:7867947-Prorocentrum_lima.AAC.1